LERDKKRKKAITCHLDEDIDFASEQTVSSLGSGFIADFLAGLVSNALQFLAVAVKNLL